MLSVKRSLNLFRISAAYGCNGICINQTALEIVRVSISFQLIRSKIISRKAGDVPHGLYIPDALELQVMYRHYRLDATVEFIVAELILQENRDQTCLPVMAVDNVGSEVNIRQNGKSCFREKCKFFNIFINVSIGLGTGKIKFIVNKIVLDPIIVHSQYTHILTSPAKIHIKMSNVFQF